MIWSNDLTDEAKMEMPIWHHARIIEGLHGENKTMKNRHLRTVHKITTVGDACKMALRMINGRHVENDYCRCPECVVDLEIGCTTPETCTSTIGQQIMRLKESW